MQLNLFRIEEKSDWTFGFILIVGIPKNVRLYNLSLITRCDSNAVVIEIGFCF
jgi:hypothetical protein